MSDAEAKVFVQNLRVNLAREPTPSFDANPPAEASKTSQQLTASTVTKLKKMRFDMLSPHPDPLPTVLMELMKRLADRSPKFIITTPGKVNESSLFDQVWKGAPAPVLSWADVAIKLDMTNDHKEIIDRRLTVQRCKRREEHLVKADPQYLYNIPLSLKDLTDEQARTSEPLQGTDLVPRKPE